MSGPKLRIKIRERGPLVYAYLDVDGADKGDGFLIGSVATALLDADPKANEDFHDLMRRTVVVLAEGLKLGHQLEGWHYEPPGGGMTQ